MAGESPIRILNLKFICSIRGKNGVVDGKEFPREKLAFKVGADVFDAVRKRAEEQYGVPLSVDCGVDNIAFMGLPLILDPDLSADECIPVMLES